MGVRFSPKTREEEWDSSQTGRLYFFTRSRKDLWHNNKKILQQTFQELSLHCYLLRVSGFSSVPQLLLTESNSFCSKTVQSMLIYIHPNLFNTYAITTKASHRGNKYPDKLSFFFFCFWKSEMATVQSVSLHLLSNSARIGLRPLLKRTT